MPRTTISVANSRSALAPLTHRSELLIARRVRMNRNAGDAYDEGAGSNQR
jgi:hypothetical protein